MSKYVDGIHEERFDNFLSDLRSGKYQQGRGALERDGKFCCLGVACIRPAAEGVVSRTEDGDGWVDYEHNSAELPGTVADYLGIPEENRTGTRYTNIMFHKMGYDEDDWDASNLTAIGLNDSLQKSFAEIADAFENEFLKEEN